MNPSPRARPSATPRPSSDPTSRTRRLDGFKGLLFHLDGGNRTKRRRTFGSCSQDDCTALAILARAWLHRPPGRRVRSCRTHDRLVWFQAVFSQCWAHSRLPVVFYKWWSREGETVRQYYDVPIDYLFLRRPGGLTIGSVADCKMPADLRAGTRVGHAPHDPDENPLSKSETWKSHKSHGTVKPKKK